MLASEEGKARLKEDPALVERARQMATGNPQARLRFKTSAAFVRFSLDGKKLLVLTAGQVAHAFEIDRLVGK